MNRILFLMIVILYASFSPAQNIRIGGVVTNKAGKAIGGAVVTLKMAALKDTTDENGFFQIRKISLNSHSQKWPLTTSSVEEIIEILDLAGKTVCKQEIKSGANNSIQRLNPGVFLARVTINGQSRVFRCIKTNSQKERVVPLQFQTSWYSYEAGLRSADLAVKDTLQIFKSTYQTAIISVHSLVDTNMTIVLDSSTSSVPSAGCGKSFTRPDPSIKQTINVAGSNRTYQLYIPTDYTPGKPLPLIFALHGGGGSAASARNDYKLEAVTKNEAIIVYPESPFWNYGSGGDIAFFDTLLKDIKNRFCIDTKNVYATGFSLGGIFVNGIGCIYGGKEVRGIMPVAGSGPNPNMGPASESDIACPAGKPTGDVAVLIIHGTADGNAAYKYGQWEANYWSKWNGCSTISISGTAPFEECKIYQSCRTPVYFYTHSGGHMVPGNAASLIWEFIKLLN
jgi:polyhydroxybutyrate depolymerase